MEVYGNGGHSHCFGTIYCNSVPNSTGVNTRIEVCGSQVGTDDNAVLRGFNLANNSFGFFITSQTQGFSNNVPGNVGNLCLAVNIGRFVAPGQVKSSGQTGEITLDTNLMEWSTQAIPLATGQPYAAMAGVTSNFQLWHRDAGPMGTVVSNFSDGIQVDWL